jgi:serine/threonine-protein kinase
MPIVLRMAALAGVLVVCIYVGLRVAERILDGSVPAIDLDTVQAPAAAQDPANVGILIAGGTLPRRNRSPGQDTIRAGPYATYDEGLGPTAVASFWIQSHEVTNEEFRRYDADHRFPNGQERHPAVNVTWREAMNYAASLGGLLPTEAQWEFAARGTEGREYPWGSNPPTCRLAQYGDCRPEGTVEVMSRPDGATPEGVHDLAGNVWEWVMPIWFEPGKTPVNDESRRMRGGSFVDDAFFLRGSNRSNDFYEGYEYVTVGFRVVWSAEERFR